MTDVRKRTKTPDVPVKPPTRKRPPPVDPTPPAPPIPAPQPAATLGAPTGIIGGSLTIAYGRGGPWSNVNRHDPYHIHYGSLYGVSPAMLKAIEVIESGGRSIPNGNGFPNFGVMQLTHSWTGGPQTKWEAIGQKLDVDFRSPQGQIAIAAYALGGHDGDAGTPEDIFLRVYYPTAGLDVPGQDGHTPRQYLSDMHELMRQIDAATGSTPAPVDVVAVIMGGAPTNTDYGFKSPTDLPYYAYFEGHGGSRWQHTGIDATGKIGQPLYSPIEGTVVCAGTDIGGGAHGSGCAAFAFTLGEKTGSSGRFEIITDDGTRSLILGHVQRSLVGVGQRVTPGQKIALLGGENGPHVHIEARIWHNGDYTIVDPRATFGGGPMPVVYAERIPIPQPADWDSGALVTITREGVPLLQRASKDALHVDSDWEVGDTFQAVMLVWSEAEEAWYWVSRARTRVPLEGTSSDLLGNR